MKLYTYFRSSAAYRVRIALNLKGLAWESVPIHLLRDGGEQLRPEYRAVHPGGMVPALEDEDTVLTQSLAIIEYLDETIPKPPLLPSHPLGRARVRALAQTIACDIHPLNNLRVLRELEKRFGANDDAKKDWYRHWLHEGLQTLEHMLAGNGATGSFSHGQRPGMADCCLVPQVFNARRYQLDMSAYPTIERIDAACAALPAFADAHPERQPDFE